MNFRRSLLLIVAAVGLEICPASADTAMPCTELPSAPLAGVRIETAELVVDRDDLGEFCRIRGTIAPDIRFEMRAPHRNWNGRFLLSGCGGYCGELITERKGYSNSINYALKRGYAATTTDSGHRGNAIDTRWAYDNPALEELFAIEWVPLAAAASRSLLNLLYGREERFAYFAGCSNGGRTAAKIAQEYPDLFDGIASGCGAFDLAKAAIQGVWLDRTLVDSNGDLVLREHKLPRLAEAVRDRCDGLDGLVDGIVSDPFACEFDPAELLCDGAGGDADCLTAAEVDEVRALYDGARDSSGRHLHPGLPYGSEHYWGRWLIGPTGSGEPHVKDLGSNYLRYMGFEQDPGPDYHSRDFDLDRDIPRLAHMARLYNATDPDLRGLRAAGTRLLMYHGLADALVVPQESIEYFESVVEEFGSLEAVNEFFRLFLIPGADHCWGVTGYAPDLFDPLKVLEQWVEEGLVPERIEARQHAAVGERIGFGPLLRTRPLCPYPATARYIGEGSPDTAENFICTFSSGDGSGH